MDFQTSNDLEVGAIISKEQIRLTDSEPSLLGQKGLSEWL
jgi:hypothetical protein